MNIDVKLDVAELTLDTYEITNLGILSVTNEGSEIEISSKDKNTLEIVNAPPKVRRQGLNTRIFKHNKWTDYSEKEAQNKELGLLGEKLVIEHENKILIESGRIDLAKKIRHISETLGDAAGYDIESYTPEGNIKHIEVKTTKGVKTSSFFMSSYELAFAKKFKGSYYLYRVFEYHKKTNTGKCFIVRNIEDELDFSPIQYRVTFVSELN